MKYRFRGAPLIFPNVEWIMNNTRDARLELYDGSIHGIRCDWNNCIIVCNDDNESDQEPEGTK